jgi:hypothetical protein
MSQHGCRVNLAFLMTGLGLFAAGGQSARAQTLFPGASFNSPMSSASLVRILLTEVSPERRIQAARLLGASGDPNTIQALSTAAVEDQDPRVRQAATSAISQLRNAIGGGVVPSPPAPTWPPLAPPLPQPPPVVQPPFVVQPPRVVQPPFVPQPPRLDPLVELTQSWYQRYLRRSIDITGLQGWVTLLRQGASHDDVKAAILGSPEYFQLQGNNAAGFVAGLYADVLGRPATRDEVAQWLNRLGQLGNDRTRLAGDFLRAAQGELRNRPGYGHYLIR